VSAGLTRLIRSLALMTLMKTWASHPVTLDDPKRPYLDSGASTMLGVQDKSLGHGLTPPVGSSIVGYFDTSPPTSNGKPRLFSI
jgi:hypothetical protein